MQQRIKLVECVHCDLIFKLKICYKVSIIWGLAWESHCWCNMHIHVQYCQFLRMWRTKEKPKQPRCAAEMWPPCSTQDRGIVVSPPHKRNGWTSTANIPRALSTPRLPTEMANRRYLLFSTWRRRDIPPIECLCHNTWVHIPWNKPLIYYFQTNLFYSPLVYVSWIAKANEI